MQPVDVYTLARTGARRAGELPLARLARLGASLLRQDGALAYDCQGLVDALGRPALRMSLHAPLALRCDRCGGELLYELAVQRVFYFVDSEAQLAAIEIDDTPEEPLLGSIQFDLAALIEDEAILQLPLSPRHAHCAPRRDASAASAPARPNPFAALQALRGHLGGPALPAAGPPEQAEQPEKKKKPDRPAPPAAPAPPRPRTRMRRTPGG